MIKKTLAEYENKIGDYLNKTSIFKLTDIWGNLLRDEAFILEDIVSQKDIDYLKNEPPTDAEHRGIK